MKYPFILFITLLACRTAEGQMLTPQVIASAHGSGASAQGSIDWTLGETITPTLIAGGSILTQGFHQGTLWATAVPGVPSAGYSILVYPNPASDVLLIRIEGGAATGLSYQLLDMAGRLVLRGNLESALTQIPVDRIAAAAYFLKVLNGERVLQSFKIVKEN